METHCFWRAAALACLLLAVHSTASATLVHTYSQDFDLRIPANSDESKGWMDPAIIEVPDHFAISDVDVGITLEHTKVFDLQIFLKSPSGTRVLLNMYDPFSEYFEGQDYSGTIFDDEAETRIEDGTAPFIGFFRLKEGNYLAAFDGQDAFGHWQLEIYDAFYADVGRLHNCTLSFTVPEPTTVLLLGLGAVLFGMTRPQK